MSHSGAALSFDSAGDLRATVNRSVDIEKQTSCRVS